MCIVWLPYMHLGWFTDDINNALVHSIQEELRWKLDLQHGVLGEILQWQHLQDCLCQWRAAFNEWLVNLYHCQDFPIKIDHQEQMHFEASGGTLCLLFFFFLFLFLRLLKKKFSVWDFQSRGHHLVWVHICAFAPCAVCLQTGYFGVSPPFSLWNNTQMRI